MQPDTTLPKEPKIKIFEALLTQSGTSDPDIIELHNTLGSLLTIIRTGNGFFTAVSSDPIFKENKTFATISSGNNDILALNTALRLNDTTINIQTYDINTGFTTDGGLYLTPLTIKIYQNV